MNTSDLLESATDEVLEDKPESPYSERAQCVIAELNSRVDAVYEVVQQQPFWKAIFAETTSDKFLGAMLREVFLSIYWYQRHTTEAGFHMLGRLPKGEVRLMKSLLAHKAEEAGHGEWALRDYLAMGGNERLAKTARISPATFAVTAVWWRMAAVEDPMGYLGAEHLFEYLTAKVTEAVLGMFISRGFDQAGVGFIVEHATEDVKHTNLIRHLIGYCVTNYPDSADSMMRCFDYFNHVYPIGVWEEAYRRALAG